MPTLVLLQLQAVFVSPEDATPPLSYPGAAIQVCPELPSEEPTYQGLPPHNSYKVLHGSIHGQLPTYLHAQRHCPRLTS